MAAETGSSAVAPAVPVPAAPTAPPAPTVPERRTGPVELLWDLVFVFAVTQVTALLAARPSWGRLGESMLALALIWWAWSAYVWAANAQPADSRVLRAVLLLATVLIFLVGLALPHAFGADGLPFAGAYALVRLLHLALYADASRHGNAARSAITGFAITVVAGMGLLLAGAAVSPGWPRALLWSAAAAIDYAGPAWLTRRRLRGLQQVAVAHFAERYGTFVIICLGESVVAVGVGVGAARGGLSLEQVLGATLGLLIAVGLWWTYFDRLAELAEGRLRTHEDPVLVASDAYSYIHLVIIAGIIIFAGGVKLVLRHGVAAAMPAPGRLAMCGGVAVYLLGLSAFRLRLFGELGRWRLVIALALMALFGIGARLPAWAVAAAIFALIGLLCVIESLQRPDAGAADPPAGAAASDYSSAAR